MEKPVVGIDLGTTFSAIAHLDSLAESKASQLETYAGERKAELARDVHVTGERYARLVKRRTALAALVADATRQSDGRACHERLPPD